MAELGENPEGTPGEDNQPAPPAWPPRIAEPPRLPFAPAQELDLTLDGSSVPEPEPEFTPGKLAVRQSAEKHELASRNRPEGQAKASAFDPRNPSGRTRGQKILYPTTADREERIRRQQRQAMLTASMVVGGLTLVFAGLHLTGWIAVILAAAIAGRVAYAMGDSEWAWAVCLGAVGICMGMNYGFRGVRMGFLFLAAAGWITGNVRAARVD
jgi:hypothetical protein